MNIKNNRRISVKIVMFILIVLVLVSGTFAYIRWSSDEEDQTEVTFALQKDYSCSADAGGDLSIEEVGTMDVDETYNSKFMPISSCLNDDYVYKKAIKVSHTINKVGLELTMNLWLDIYELSSSLSNNSNLKYVVTTSPASCNAGTVVSSGDFSELYTGSKINILNNKLYLGPDQVTETYYLYIWLDAAETNPDTSEGEFRFAINGNCGEVEPEPNKPVLDAGMIPVTISSDGSTTTVSEDNPLWYDYSNKKWANVVLVNEDSRDSYLGTDGQLVNKDDILAYYVWIPRYKYKLFNNNGEDSEVLIDVIFEGKDKEKSRDPIVGKYYTHPAFTFGGVELSGIWVGKYEITGTTAVPTILPAKAPIKGGLITQNGLEFISDFFHMALKFAGGSYYSSINAVRFDGNSVYGLSQKVNSHMIKNSEWGAIAYLTHSKYGIGTSEIAPNPEPYLFSASDGTYSYGGAVLNSSSDSYSTTGNVTGVFGMAGGAYEVVLGYYDTSQYSEFDDYITDYLESKYYDLYTSTNVNTACNGGKCYGHALSETSHWYGDRAIFVDANHPVLHRGGATGGQTDNVSNIGIFNYYNLGIDTGIDRAATRSVLIIE